MTLTRSVLYSLATAALLTGHHDLFAAEPSPVNVQKATASAVYSKYSAGKAVDGVVSDASRWVGTLDARGRAWLELTLSKKLRIGGIHLYSGYGNANPLQKFHVEFKNANGEWEQIPSSLVNNNDEVALRLDYDTSVKVYTDALMLVVKGKSGSLARVKEIEIWPESTTLPELRFKANRGKHANRKRIPTLYLNQSGFNLGKPKRFTAPLLSDGTPFSIHPAEGDEVLYKGTIQGHRGDFSPFNPTDGSEYVLKAGGETSVPFAVSLWQLERITYQNAMNFMIDSRHYVGNYKKKCGGSFGWRDDHHFGWELRTLVPQYLSNPAAYDRMPHQVTLQPNSLLAGRI
jgi:hypothetical protein